MDSRTERHAPLTADEMKAAQDERRKKIKEMYDGGASVREIATHLGVTNATVQGDLAKEGIHPQTAPAQPAPEAEAMADRKTQRLEKHRTTQRMEKSSARDKPEGKRAKRVKWIIAATALLGVALIGYGVHHIIETRREQEAEKQMAEYEKKIIDLQIAKKTSQKTQSKWPETEESKLQGSLREYDEFLDHHPSLKPKKFMRHD